jgi:hypothetical protein
VSYRADIEFLIVYVREAHPNLLPEGNTTGVVGNPKDLRERAILATQCVSQYKFTIPMVLDGMDGKVNRDYDAAPVRVTIVDVDGKVVFYAGRGPADFRIPPVESILRNLVAHRGHVAPAAALQWGEPVGGRRCGLSIAPQNLSLGEKVTIVLKFQNVSGRGMALPCDPAETLKRITIRNDGLTLTAVASDAGRDPPRRSRRVPLQKIRPGLDFETEVEAKIVSVSHGVAPVAGTFQAVYSLEVAQETLADLESVSQQPLWRGKTMSGVCVLHVFPSRQGDPKK